MTFSPIFVSPTKERSLKPDYEMVGTGKHKQRAKSKTVQSLHDCGEIGGEEVSASERWLKDYLFAEHGYGDALLDPLPREVIKGDEHTFTFARAKAHTRIRAVRDHLGLCSHTRLKWLLVDGLSFSALGKKLWPHKGRTDAIAHVRGQCVLLLQQLAHFYIGVHKKRES